MKLSLASFVRWRCGRSGCDSYRHKANSRCGYFGGYDW